MRIISGSARGLRIQSPKSARPTTDRVREALFSILGPRVDDADILDLFAGSGSLSLEALSRGARSAVLVEQNPAACRLIQENLQSTKLHSPHCQISKSEVFQWIKRQGSASPRKFDLIFADPPYELNESNPLSIRLLQHAPLASLLSPDGLFILEDSPRVRNVETAHWQLIDERKYGETRLRFFQPTSSSEAESTSTDS